MENQRLTALLGFTSVCLLMLSLILLPVLFGFSYEVTESYANAPLREQGERPLRVVAMIVFLVVPFYLMILFFMRLRDLFMQEKTLTYQLMSLLLPNALIFVTLGYVTMQFTDFYLDTPADRRQMNNLATLLLLTFSLHNNVIMLLLSYYLWHNTILPYQVRWLLVVCAVGQTVFDLLSFNADFPRLVLILSFLFMPTFVITMSAYLLLRYNAQAATGNSQRAVGEDRL